MTAILLLFLLFPFLAFAQGQPARLKNGGFEGGASDGRGGGVPGWSAFENGYTIDKTNIHNGEQSIRCDSINDRSVRGAQTVLTLNQTRPIPVQVVGWGKADAVSGVRDGDYSLYVDLEYTDGTPLWGLTAPFRVGTHDWERRQILVLPTKPIKTLTVYALFRKHSGTAWFDDFSVRQLEGGNLFDSQVMPELPPRNRLTLLDKKQSIHVQAKDGLALDVSPKGDIFSITSGGQEVGSAAAGGFWLRDVKEEAPPVALRGSIQKVAGGGVRINHASEAARVKFTAKIVPQGDALTVDGELTDAKMTDRAVTVYLVLPVNAVGWQWGQDIRQAEKIASGREYTHQVRVNVGATGGLSLYPFGCISSDKHALGIASQQDWPSVYRIFYNGTTRQFVIAWDFALTSKTATWPGRNARFRCTLFRLPPNQAAWGFRAAAQRFYRLNAPNFDRRAKAEGIWIPFTNPAHVQRHQDFHFAYHEGDNSLKSDDALGILSFRYTEPMSFWMNMPKEMERTYDNALTHLKKLASGEMKEANNDPRMAQATLNSGAQDETEKFNVEFRKEPWADGALFFLNPNPELPHTPEKPTKASVSYNLTLAETMYGPKAKEERGEQDGEYLDSLEAWSDLLDYRPSHLSTIPYPIPFETDSRQPALPQWYSTHTFTRFLRNEMRNRGKLLFANSTPIRFSIYAPLLDIMGIEVNWLDGNGKWRPEDDATMNLRRTLSAQKPYLLLMNTDYDKFTPDLVEKYFQRCLFYGIYPSMFSHNAADNPYWDTPRWYNRDRPLFVKYIPVIQKLSAAGWEPITYAHSSNPNVFVERFGTRTFTLFNPTGQPQETILALDLRALGLSAANIKITRLPDEPMNARSVNNNGTFSIRLQPEQALALEIR